jgi:thymidylate synthase
VAKELLTRIPNEFPTIFIKERQRTELTDFVWEDIILCGYNPHGTIDVKFNI